MRKALQATTMATTVPGLMNDILVTGPWRDIHCGLNADHARANYYCFGLSLYYVHATVYSELVVGQPLSRMNVPSFNEGDYRWSIVRAEIFATRGF